MAKNQIYDPVKACMDLEEQMIDLEKRIKELEDMILSDSFTDKLTQKIVMRVHPHSPSVSSPLPRGDIKTNEG
jgi:hypothetical protein